MQHKLDVFLYYYIYNIVEHQRASTSALVRRWKNRRYIESTKNSNVTSCDSCHQRSESSTEARAVTLSSFPSLSGCFLTLSTTQHARFSNLVISFRSLSVSEFYLRRVSTPLSYHKHYLVSTGPAQIANVTPNAPALLDIPQASLEIYTNTSWISRRTRWPCFETFHLASISSETASRSRPDSSLTDSVNSLVNAVTESQGRIYFFWLTRFPTALIQKARQLKEYCSLILPNNFTTTAISMFKYIQVY